MNDVAERIALLERVIDQLNGFKAQFERHLALPVNANSSSLKKDIKAIEKSIAQHRKEIAKLRAMYN